MTRVAVITGAAGGIGAATRELFVEEGWQVVAIDRQAIDAEGALQIDLADTDSLVAALGDLPRVDVLINNAALQLYKTIEDTSFEDWDAVHDVNLRAAFVTTKTLMPALSASHGAVVNVASVHAQATSRAIGAYAATKGGLVAFTRAAALELAPQGVRVNAVLPGAIETPALREGLGRAARAEQILIERTPLGRIGRARDVAKTIEFLADSERSGFITGQTIIVDGGALARLSTE